MIASGGSDGADATFVHTTAGFARGTARDAGASVRLPGRADPGAAPDHRNAGRADPDPGLFQFRSRLSSEPRNRRGALRGGAVRAHRRQQLLRVGRRRCDQPFRVQLRRGAGDCGRRPDRGSGHAFGGEDRE